ncbi:unnamed protein product [Phytophthora fragariaefolia]|uniref:Unnamed protein product n=1 Tax=Phytophthora fragariaefolia TaxID=1490495 RepID=A0A9W6XDZ0_9STRA|nr:unnamed protein product [Phytophthora fragariaefolia]
MANKKKRSRAQAASTVSDRGGAKPVAPVQSKHRSKKKPKFSKTLSTDAAVANDSKLKEKIEHPVAESTAADGASAAKKKKKKKNKTKGTTTATPANDAGKNEAKKAKASEIDDLFASLKTEKQKKSIEEEQQKLAEEEEERREIKEKERLHQQIKKLEAQNTNSTAIGLNPDPRPASPPMLMEDAARPPKRLASVLDNPPALAKRLETNQNGACTPPSATTLAAAPSAIEIRAFGLEDRAEAVISRGKESWTLANLSKWRHESLDDATDTQEHSNKLSSKEYLRQRQRAYRLQCLAASSRTGEASRQGI